MSPPAEGLSPKAPADDIIDNHPEIECRTLFARIWVMPVAPETLGPAVGCPPRGCVDRLVDPVNRARLMFLSMSRIRPRSTIRGLHSLEGALRTVC